MFILVERKSTRELMHCTYFVTNKNLQKSLFLQKKPQGLIHQNESLGNFLLFFLPSVCLLDHVSKLGLRP